MKVAFDARYAQDDLLGMGKYIRHLVLGLADRGIECVLFYSKEPKNIIENKNILSVILPSDNKYLFEQVFLPIALKKFNVDIYHATSGAGIPFFCPVSSVLTVHDVIPLEIPGYFSRSRFPWLSMVSYKLRLLSSVFNATKITAVSKYTKSKLVEVVNISPKKIRVVYSGMPILATPGKLPKALIGNKYILNHGGLDTRKNIDNLIKAFFIVHKKYSSLKLVITGDNASVKSQLMAVCRSLKLGDSIIFTGYVDDRTLSVLVKKAMVICYPTKNEGFGFPVLEGLGSGVPVVSSNTSSIPEISGESAILINPDRVKEISNALFKVLSNVTAARSGVFKNRKKLFEKFNWRKTINEYLDLYNHI